MQINDLSPLVIRNSVLAVLAVLLTVVVWSDVKQYRIPNKIVFFGAGLGIFLNSVLPEGYGFISTLPGALGLWKSLTGFGIALGILLPLYVLRGIGAGDVKLMAMVGAFLGSKAIVSIILLTFVVGGILSIFFSLKRKKLEELVSNLSRLVKGAIFHIFFFKELPTLSDIPSSVGKFPYAAAVAIGTASYFLLIGYTNFSDLF